jgi:hypothetical protein
MGCDRISHSKHDLSAENGRRFCRTRRPIQPSRAPEGSPVRSRTADTGRLSSSRYVPTQTASWARGFLGPGSGWSVRSRLAGLCKLKICPVPQVISNFCRSLREKHPEETAHQWLRGLLPISFHPLSYRGRNADRPSGLSFNGGRLFTCTCRDNRGEPSCLRHSSMARHDSRRQLPSPL